MNKQLPRNSASGGSTAVDVSSLKMISNEFNGLRKTFASRAVYRSLLYVLKVAMRANSKRFQTTHDICKFYLHLYTDQQQSKFSVCYLAMEVQSEISCVHHLFSVIHAFLFLVELVLAERDSKNAVVSFFLSVGPSL